MKKCMHHETSYGLPAGIQTRESLRGGYGHTFPGTGPGSGAKCSDFLLIPDHFRSPNLSQNSKTRFTVTFQAISSMVGTIASRIGILCATRTSGGVHNYELKEKYVGIVVGIVGVN